MLSKRPMCVICMGFLLLLWIVLETGPPYEPALPAGVCEGERIELAGTVYRTEEKNGNQIIYLKNIFLATGNCGTSRVILYLSKHQNSNEQFFTNQNEYRSLSIGSVIKVEGTFQLFDRAENEGQFDTRRYYHTMNIAFMLIDAKVVSVGNSYSPIRAQLQHFRESIGTVYQIYLDEEDAGTMQALVLGDKTDLNPELKEQYQQAGIAHILALSGVKMLLLALMKQSLNRTNTAFIAISCGDKYIIIQYILSTIMRCCRSHSIRGVIFKKYDLAKGIYYLA